jgi:hypothetical protein
MSKNRNSSFLMPFSWLGIIGPKDIILRMEKSVILLMTKQYLKKIKKLFKKKY